MMPKNILIVVAHPDDETISMAGTIRKHVNNGDSVKIISMTDGVSARLTSKIEDASNRKKSAEKASEILGFSWEAHHNFNDNAMDGYPLIEIIQCIEKIKKKLQPELVYTHSGADLNIDHRVVSNAVLTVFRPEPNEKCKELRLFEVASATDYGNHAVTGSFAPNLFVNISQEWPSKLRALEAYSSEMRNYPHSRSIKGIENLAKLRGNQIGYELAEAFEVLRKIEP